MRKKVIALAMIAAMVVSLTACGGKNNDKQGKDSTESLKVAYQSGIAYAPILVMKDQKLIEKNYDGNVDIDWQLLSGGAAISEGQGLKQVHHIRFLQECHHSLIEYQQIKKKLRL